LTITRGFKEPEHAAKTVAEARGTFDAEFADRSFGDLVVVIAALNEAGNLPDVLDEIPGMVAGIPLDVLVVDDGSEDATSEVARRHGAAVLRLSRNCGHGVALRAGYRAAWEHGARYIATLDADGQWDPADLPAMVELVVAGDADLVIGSRALGETRDTDSFRTLGVRAFSLLARVLTGVTVTDTSSGLRVMTPELLRNVPQTQPQYQTSELVVGAALAGYRIAEVPTVMRPRISGTSRKGHNLAYGLRYARVMVGTWWRESRRHGVRQIRLPLGTRLIRYTAGSAICLVVSEIALFVLLLAGVQGWAASLLASAAGIIPGYPLNRTWTFGRRGRSHVWREVMPYWLATLGGALFAALLVGIATPLVKNAGTTALMTAVVGVVVYVGAYGSIWLLKFVYLDRLLFRPQPAELSPRRVSPPVPRSVQEPV
jgi:glycosyltransferase involved in cell wall biosynthesis